MTTINAAEFKTQVKALLRLGGPLMVNNLAVAGMQVADAIMAGSIGARELAAVAVGGSFWFLGFSLCLGILMAISPIVARHFGAGNFDRIGRYTRQGLYLSVLMGIPIVLMGQFAAAPLLEKFGIDPDFRDLTVGYVSAITWGAPGIFMFLALRFTTEGIGHTRPIMFTSILGLTCNVFLNYVLMFGHFGAPALGAVGCGYASAISMWIVMAALGGYMLFNSHYRPFHLFSRLAPLRLSAFKEIICSHHHSGGRTFFSCFDSDGYAGNRNYSRPPDCNQLFLDNVHGAIGAQCCDDYSGRPVHWCGKDERGSYQWTCRNYSLRRLYDAFGRIPAGIP